MAEVFRHVKGEQIERLIAHTRDAKRGLFGEAFDIMVKAQKNLAAVRANPGYTGNLNAELRIIPAGLDYEVAMIDPPDGSSPGAAASIEYGHYAGKRGTPNRPWVEGKWVLHDAAGRDRRLR